MITPEAIRKLAELSALSVSSADEAVYAQQLTQVLNYMDVLRQHTPSDAHIGWPIHKQTHTRSDHAVNLNGELPQGFHRTHGGFQVPKISTAQS